MINPSLVQKFSNWKRVASGRKSFINEKKFDLQNKQTKKNIEQLQFQQKKHPTWCFLKEKNGTYELYFTNETTKKHHETKMLLGKESIPNSNKQIVTQGYCRTFDKKKTEDMLELTEILETTSEFIPNHEQPIPTEIDVKFQDLDYVAKNDCLETIMIQNNFVSNLGVDLNIQKEIITAHAFSNKSNLKTGETITNAKKKYLWAQRQHQKLSIDPQLTNDEKHENNIVWNRMNKAISNFMNKKNE